jgi:hypothetical protein
MYNYVDAAYKNKIKLEKTSMLTIFLVDGYFLLYRKCNFPHYSQNTDPSWPAVKQAFLLQKGEQNQFTNQL